MICRVSGAISEGIPALIWFMMGVQLMGTDPAFATISFMIAIAEIFFAVGIATEIEGTFRAALVERGTTASIFSWTFFVTGQFMYLVAMVVNLASVITLVICYLYQGRMTLMLEELFPY